MITVSIVASVVVIVTVAAIIVEIISNRLSFALFGLCLVLVPLSRYSRQNQ